MTLAVDTSSSFNNTGSVNSGTATLTTNFGNEIIVVCGYSNNSDWSGVSDSASLTWNKLASISNSNPTYAHIYWAYTSSTLSSDVITVSLVGSSSALVFCVFGVTGAGSLTSPWDTNSNLPVQQNSSSDVHISTNSSSTLDLAVYILNGATGGAGSGMTAIYNNNFMLVEYTTSSSPQTNLDMTLSSGTPGLGLGHAISGTAPTATVPSGIVIIVA